MTNACLIVELRIFETPQALQGNESTNEENKQQNPRGRRPFEIL